MYRRGDLKLCTRKLNGPMYDARGPELARQPSIWIELPHSCQEFIVGGIAEVEQLIRDAQVSLSILRGRGASEKPWKARRSKKPRKGARRRGKIDLEFEMERAKKLYVEWARRIRDREPVLLEACKPDRTIRNVPRGTRGGS